MLRSALAELRWIGDEDARLQLMASLAPFLPEELLDEAFIAARRIKNEARRSRAVVHAAACLPDNPFSEAEYTVKAVRDQDSREQALANLALSRINRGDHDTGLRIASDLADESRRADVLVRMAPALPMRLLTP
jgi:hypothetical protein